MKWPTFTIHMSNGWEVVCNEPTVDELNTYHQLVTAQDAVSAQKFMEELIVSWTITDRKGKLIPPPYSLDKLPPSLLSEVIIGVQTYGRNITLSSDTDDKAGDTTAIKETVTLVS